MANLAVDIRLCKQIFDKSFCVLFLPLCLYCQIHESFGCVTCVTEMRFISLEVLRQTHCIPCNPLHICTYAHVKTCFLIIAFLHASFHRQSPVSLLRMSYISFFIFGFQLASSLSVRLFFGYRVLSYDQRHILILFDDAELTQLIHNSPLPDCVTSENSLEFRPSRKAMLSIFVQRFDQKDFETLKKATQMPKSAAKWTFWRSLSYYQTADVHAYSYFHKLLIKKNET